jgi:hypothetical protein
MLTMTKIALSAVILLGVVLPASAATKPHATHVKRSAIYDVVPDYNAARNPSPPLLETPDRFGIQSQR